MPRPTATTPSVPTARPPTLSARLEGVLRALPSISRVQQPRRDLGYAAGYTLWAFLALRRVLALVVTQDGVDELRASGSYNDVPGWLGPGAWLAYCVTTYTALARALCALRAESRLRVERLGKGAARAADPDAQHPVLDAWLEDIVLAVVAGVSGDTAAETDAADGADDVWDPDLTTSALFTLFAWVALLANSREQADADANLLVLAAVGVAVVAGFCVGQLGSVLWLSVLWRVVRRLPSPRRVVQDPQGRTALRRLAVYGALAVGSMSVLFVFNLRMGTRALSPTNTRGRAPFLLSLDVDFGGNRPAGSWLGPWLMFPTRIVSIFALLFALNLRGNPLWRGTSRSVLRSSAGRANRIRC
jgi:hypothetical protein